MLRRALRVFSRLLLVSGACLAALLGLAIVLPVQSLPSAQITVVGKVRGRASHPVTVAVRLPGGYGLTASERRDGWAALNAEGQVDVALDGSGFAAEMPRARYCITKWMWQETPPPPAWFVLRFSDAPGEEYVVWSFGGRSGYVVRGLEGAEVPGGSAAWRIDVGRLRRREGGDRRDRWLLDLTLERQGSDGQPDDDERGIPDLPRGV